MSIELPGYKAIFPNQVYSRGTSLTKISGEPVPGLQILLPTRYTEPTEDEVVAYLQKKADEVEAIASLILPSNVIKGKKPVEIALAKLPENVRRDVTSDKNCIEFIRRNTQAINPENGELLNYVTVQFGVLPIEMIEKNKPDSEKPEWYGYVLLDKDVREAGIGEGWQLKLRLYDGVLPDKSDIDVLLKHGTHDSRSLCLSIGRYDEKEVGEVLGALYAGLQTPESIGQLKDVSDKVLESFSLQPVMSLHKMVAVSRAADQSARSSSDDKKIRIPRIGLN